MHVSKNIRILNQFDQNVDANADKETVVNIGKFIKNEKNIKN